MTRPPLREDDLDRRVPGPGGKPDLAATAAWFEELAADPNPDDAPSVAELLLVAGEYWSLAGDATRALDLFRRAVSDGGATQPDARCHLLGGLLALDLDDEAAAVAADIKAARLSDPEVYAYVAEAYEWHGDLPAATQWFTTGMLRGMRDGAPQWAVVHLMRGRARVRQAQGFPPDEYDEQTLAVDDQI
jgi:tetratricopeptide (TPR) repeat protein